MSKLGIIAGAGDLPRAIAQSAREDGREVFIVSLIPLPGEWSSQYPCESASLGELGKVLRILSANDCHDVILAGRVDRPRFSELKLDSKAALAIPRVASAALKGDDALLKAIVEIFEKEGHRVVSVADAAPSLVVREGVIGAVRPSDAHIRDAQKGFEIVRQLGALDVGQAAIVCDGLVLAVEAAEGTDAMLKRIGHLPEHLRGTAGHPRGVLVKALKPIQDRKTDIPVIGLETVSNALVAGLAGIALEAGGALIIDREQVVKNADAAKLFLIGIHPIGE